MDQVNKNISKKLFWTLLIISNISPLYYFFSAAVGFFEPETGDLIFVGLIVALVCATLYGALVNIVLFLRKKAQDRKNFIILASIFIFIGIFFLAGPPIAYYYGDQHDAKVNVEAKKINQLIIEAHTFDECAKIDEKITCQENKDLLKRCLRRVLYITKDVDSCLSVAKLAEFPWWNINYSDYTLRAQCIYSYAFITQDDKYCDLLNNVKSSRIQDCKRDMTKNNFIRKELSEVFSDIKNIEECGRYTHEDIENICRDYISKK
jgi:hypothetical protein